jgi:pimeloyl-ACP methyl ester carboxylesterase
MDKVTRTSVTLNARTVGARAADRELLLIHGLNANMAFWHPALVRELAAGRFLLMYDQRGHGRSDMPSSGYTSSELARDAAAVLDAYGVEGADVVAHSFGSTVALQLARLFPTRVRSLVLLDARLRLFQPVLKLGDWPDFERWRTSLGAAGEGLDPGLDLDFMLPLYLASTGLRAASRDLAANGFAPMGGGRRGAARYRRLIEETTARADYQQPDGLDIPALRALSCRMLAIYGSRSPFLDTHAALQRELPGCESRIVDGGGHNFPVVFPEHTARLLLEFLETGRGSGDSAGPPGVPPSLRDRRETERTM